MANSIVDMDDYGWVGIVLFQLIVISGIAALTLRQFISFRRTIWYASFFSCAGWALCFSIVLMVPVDIIDVCTSSHYFHFILGYNFEVTHKTLFNDDLPT